MSTKLMSALLAVAFVLTGCQSNLTDTAEESTSTDVATEAPDNPPAPEPAQPNQPRPQPPTRVLSPCDDDVKDSIDATIGAQAQAFRDGDFEAAFDLASPSFQAGFTVDVFARLIRLNYPQLLTAENARSGSCEVDNDNGLATILVRFETASDPTYTLRYVMELVEGQWRISGANQEAPVDTVA